MLSVAVGYMFCISVQQKNNNDSGSDAHCSGSPVLYNEHYYNRAEIFFEKILYHLLHLISRKILLFYEDMQNFRSIGDGLLVPHRS